MAKKTTLNESGEMLTHVVQHMATNDDAADLAKKDDVRNIVRAETKDIRDELAFVRRNLDRLTTAIENVLAFPQGDRLRTRAHRGNREAPRHRKEDRRLSSWRARAQWIGSADVGNPRWFMLSEIGSEDVFPCRSLLGLQFVLKNAA